MQSKNKSVQPTHARRQPRPGQQTIKDNPPLPWFLNGTLVLVMLVLLFGTGLLFVYDTIKPLWPWDIKPFNARLLGAVYLSELTAIVVLFISGRRWAPARLIIPQALTFTTVVTVASFINIASFDFNRIMVWAWFILYIVPTIILAYYGWLYHNLPPAVSLPPPVNWQRYLAGQGVVLGLYGLGLFILPAIFGAFWPWEFPAFYGRSYAGVFLAGAVGSLTLWRAAAPIEMLALGLTQFVLGFFVIAGFVMTDMAVQRIAWAAPGTWLWLAIFAILAIAGALMTLQYWPKVSANRSIP